MGKPDFLRLLDELFEFDEGTLTGAETLQEISGWSSLTFVGLIALLDEECGITLAPAAILNCKTVDDLFHLVAQKTGAAKKAA
jgi:acyl carrier protein